MKPRQAELFARGDSLVKPYRSPRQRRVLIGYYPARGRTLQAGAL